jgi:hypothetical protein
MISCLLQKPTRDAGEPESFKNTPIRKYGFEGCFEDFGIIIRLWTIGMIFPHT